MISGKDNASPAAETLPPYQDDIPRYSPSLEFYGVALFQVEFDSPWSDNATSLEPVVVELNLNQLNIYGVRADKSVLASVKALFKHQNYVEEPEAPPTFSPDYFFDGDAYGDDAGTLSPGVVTKMRKRYIDKKIQRRLLTLPDEFAHNDLLLEPTADRTRYLRFAAKYRGRLMHSFTLQNLAVGEAPSTLRKYKEDMQQSCSYTDLHYRNVLRLRVEHIQALLHLWSFHGMVHWFRNLRIGSDLATLLDARKLGALKSIPRNFSVSNNALLQLAAREALLSQDVDKLPRDAESECLSLCCSSIGLHSLGTGCTSIYDECVDKTSVDVFGARLVCLENYYTPVEKQYISNCIPVLNSFDKWAGARMTLSNSPFFAPKNTHSEKLYISPLTFVGKAKKSMRLAPSAHLLECREFHVDELGLVSIA